MKQSKFSITRFENYNGTAAWRVDGNLHGLRIRKNFKSREEAGAGKAVLEIQALQAASGIRPATTFLTDAQLRQAEDAFRRIEGRTKPLLAYLDYALANYREYDQLKPLDEAVAEYYTTKKTAFERTLLSLRQLRSIENELTLLKARFPKAQMSEFTAAKLLPFLERGSPSLKTYNNRRGLVSTFFKFAYQKDWTLLNPVEKTPHHRINHRRGSATTLTVERAAELMAFVETFEGGEMVALRSIRKENSFSIREWRIDGLLVTPL